MRWRAGRTLHVEMIGSCVPCHGANFGDRMAPALYAVTVTGVDKLEVTAVPARCTDNCGEVP